MAAKVNTKFILLVVLIVVFVGGGLVGLGLLYYRADASRNIDAGNQHMAKGEYEKALDQYGRAVHKQATNSEYIRLAQSALSKIQPTTQEKANEYYGRYLFLLTQEARNRPADAEAHLRLIEEVYYGARLFNETQTWKRLANVAEDMWNRVREDDPKRIYGLLYKAISITRQREIVSDGELDDAEEDLKQVVAQLPNEDLAQGALANIQLEKARRAYKAANSRRAEELMGVAEQTLATANEHVSDGLNIVMAGLLRSAIRQEYGNEVRTFDSDLAMATALASAARKSTDPVGKAEAALVLRLFGKGQALDDATSILSDYLATNPNGLYHYWVLAQIQLDNDQLDASEATLKKLREAPLAEVGVLAQIQRLLQRFALALQVNVDFRRWELASGDERADRIVAIQASRDRLRDLVGSDNDPGVLHADGRIAYTKADFRTAASKFEEIIRRADAVDVQTLQYSALCLEQLGDIGAAESRLRRALDIESRNLHLMIERGRLLAMMRRTTEANEVFTTVLRIDPTNERARQMNAVVESQKVRGLEGGTQNPRALAIANVKAAFDQGDFDGARQDLLEMLKADGPTPDLAVLMHLIQVEFQTNNLDKVREYLDMADRVSPGNRELRGVRTLLDNADDPVEMRKAYAAQMYGDPVERIVMTLVSLQQYVLQQNTKAAELDRVGKTAEAEEARVLAERADAEAARLAETARKAEIGNPVLTDYLFTEALRAKNWTEAERLIQEARRTNADGAEGHIFEGRLAIERNDPDRAIRAFTVATQKKDYSAYGWRLLGLSYELARRNTDALRAYDAAYERNPNDITLIKRYWPHLVSAGRGTAALRTMQSAAKLWPNDSEIREAWLRLEAQFGERAVALRERRVRYNGHPEDRVNGIELAQLFINNQPDRADITDRDPMRPKYDPAMWSRLDERVRQDELTRTKTAWRVEAERILASIAKDNPRDIEVASLRARNLLSAGDVAAGEKLLRQLIDSRGSEGPTAPMLIALGSFQLESGRPEQAHQTLQEALKAQDPQIREADYVLGNLYFAQSDFTNAAMHYEKVLEVRNDRNLRLLAIECHVKKRDFAAARERLNAFETESGEDMATAMFKAAIAEGEAEELLRAGKAEEAETKYAEQLRFLDRAEQLDATQPSPNVQRARAMVLASVRKNEPSQLEAAMRELDRAETKRPGDLSVSSLRIDIYLARQDMTRAVAEMERLLAGSPENSNVRRRLVQTYIQLNNLNKAAEVIEVGVGQPRIAAEWLEIQGDFNMTQRKDYAAAERSYARANDLRPSRTLLIKRVEAMRSAPKPDFSTIIALIEPKIPDMQGDPMLRNVYGAVLAQANRRDAAMVQLRTAYTDHKAVLASTGDTVGLAAWFEALAYLYPRGQAAQAQEFVLQLANNKPNWLEMRMLARNWAQSGPDGLTQALEWQRKSLEAIPSDNDRSAMLKSDTLYDLANLQIGMRDYDAAAESLQRSLDLGPDRPAALNNLAYLKAKIQNKPQEALPLAQRAVEITPNDPNALDTLGWIYMQTGDLANAEVALRRSVDLEKSATNHKNLAEVLIKKGDDSGAQTYLRRAAELRPDPETNAEINRLMDDIKSRTG